MKFFRILFVLATFSILEASEKNPRTTEFNSKDFQVQFRYASEEPISDFTDLKETAKLENHRISLLIKKTNEPRPIFLKIEKSRFMDFINSHGHRYKTSNVSTKNIQMISELMIFLRVKTQNLPLSGPIPEKKKGQD